MRLRNVSHRNGCGERERELAYPEDKLPISYARQKWSALQSYMYKKIKATSAYYIHAYIYLFTHIHKLSHILTHTKKKNSSFCILKENEHIHGNSWRDETRKALEKVMREYNVVIFLI